MLMSADTELNSKIEALSSKLDQVLNLLETDEKLPIAVVIERYGISRRKIYYLVEEGKLNIYKLEGKAFFLKSEIERLIEKK